MENSQINLMYLNMYFLCRVERNLLKMNMKKTEKIIKKIRKKQRKNYFAKFAPKRSAPKWTSNKKGHAIVVAPKRRASHITTLTLPIQMSSSCLEGIISS